MNSIRKRQLLENELKKYVKNPIITRINNTYEINIGFHLLFHELPEHCTHRYNLNGDLIIIYENKEKIINLGEIYETLKYIYKKYNGD